MFFEPKAAATTPPGVATLAKSVPALMQGAMNGEPMEEEVAEPQLTNSQKAEQHKATGTDFYKAGDWQAACTEYG